MDMKSARVFGVGFALLVSWSIRSEAQSTAPGPYFPVPSWDLSVPCPSSSNCPRFIVLSNLVGAVLDVETGLVWQRAPTFFSGTAWAPAMNFCTSLVIDNRMGWRMPTVHELSSLVDLTGPAPLNLPAGHPFQAIQHVIFWTSTTDPENNDNALQVFFDK